MPHFVGGGGGTAGRPHPYGRITNRIITRGMGPHINRLICQGYGGPPAFVIAAIGRGIIVGQSGAKRRLRDMDQVIVWAKLIEVNRQPPKTKPNNEKVQGFVIVPVTKGYGRVIVAHVSSRVKKAWEDLKVSVKRIK